MTLLGFLIVATLGWGSATLQQTTAGAMDDVSRTLDAARKEIAAHKTAGGAARGDVARGAGSAGPLTVRSVG